MYSTHIMTNTNKVGPYHKLFYVFNSYFANASQIYDCIAELLFIYISV